MAQADEALKRYTDAQDRLIKAVTERHNLVIRLEGLSLSVKGQAIQEGYVKMFNVSRAQGLIDEISKLEAEITSAVADMNTNATMSGRQTIRTSN